MRITMPRWHADECQEPDVVLEGDYPRCRACGHAASLDWILAQQVPASAASSIPPDKTSLPLNLSWPPQVPWSVPEEGSDASAGPDANEPNGIHFTKEQPVDASYAQTYGERLDSDEIRLLCLHATETSDKVVHVELEAYKHSECPEYETVSYAWGGEDGDARLSEPVYVGPYWDVLLQTRNCAALLRYLRPARGLRMVWIDALCINQGDTAERESQVARMGDIYRQCTRVVVWLGADIVTPTAPKSFQPRFPFREIQAHIPEKGYVGRLFRRRYFSRMWVIQELVLAPSSVIPLLDADFLAGAWTTGDMASVSETEYWQTLKRSWMSQMHSVTKFPGETLDDVLRYTWNTSMQATDPRDRIFGVLGLHQPTSLARLMPDYSLSFQSLVIGITVHLLAVDGSFEVLCNAVGLGAKPAYPSWTIRLEQGLVEFRYPKDFWSGCELHHHM